MTDFDERAEAAKKLLRQHYDRRLGEGAEPGNYAGWLDEATVAALEASGFKELLAENAELSAAFDALAARADEGERRLAALERVVEAARGFAGECENPDERIATGTEVDEGWELGIVISDCRRCATCLLTAALAALPTPSTESDGKTS
jgi:hypothetical protein